jgi:hypothetical protein
VYSFKTDLFLALLDKRNLRGNPILLGLLYAFCPAAARWWLNGVDPSVIFNPVWSAVDDYTAGKTLKQALVEHGFEGLLDCVRPYIDKVVAYRRMHTGILAPELMPTFKGNTLELYRRFGLDEVIERFGNKIDNFFVYMHAWAFLIQDWKVAMRLEGDGVKFERVQIMLSVHGIQQPAIMTAWLWKLAIGPMAEARLLLGGLSTSTDPLRFSLFNMSAPEGKFPWSVHPEVWVLNERDGSSDAFEQTLTPTQTGDVVKYLNRLATKSESSPPLVGLQDPRQCEMCGFQTPCYIKKRHFNPIVFQEGTN